MKVVFIILITFVGLSASSQNIPVSNGKAFDYYLGIPTTQVSGKPTTVPGNDSTRAWLFADKGSKLAYKWNITTKAWDTIGAPLDTSLYHSYAFYQGVFQPLENQRLSTANFVQFRRVQTDTLTTPLHYRLFTGFTDNTNNIAFTTNTGFVMRPGYAYTANNQAFVGVVIDPVLVGTNSFTGTSVAALKVNGNTMINGNLMPGTAGSTNSLGTGGYYWGDSYLSQSRITTLFPNNIQIPVSNSISFKTYTGTQVGKFGDAYGSWVFGLAPYTKADASVFSLQGDRYAVSGYGGGFSTDGTIRPGKSGDTLYGANLRYIYDATPGGVSAGTITAAGSGLSNGSYSVLMSGGSGSDARFQITISGGSVTSAVPTVGGKNYAVNDVLTASGYSGFTYKVTAIGYTGVKYYPLMLNGEIYSDAAPLDANTNYAPLVYDSTSKTFRKIPRTGYFVRTANVLSPTTAGDNISTTGAGSFGNLTSTGKQENALIINNSTGTYTVTATDYYVSLGGASNVALPSTFAYSGTGIMRTLIIMNNSGSAQTLTANGSEVVYYQQTSAGTYSVANGKTVYLTSVGSGGWRVNSF